MTDADAKKWACPGHEWNAQQLCRLCGANPLEVVRMEKERASMRRRVDKAIKWGARYTSPPTMAGLRQGKRK